MLQGMIFQVFCIIGYLILCGLRTYIQLYSEDKIVLEVRDNALYVISLYVEMIKIKLIRKVGCCLIIMLVISQNC